MPEHAVIDTNVALDLLVFRDPRSAAVAAALHSGRLMWRATAAMRAELEHVATPGLCQAWNTSCERTLSEFDRLAELVEEWPPGLRTASPRCTDPDDQMFIDLAVASRAAWLLSRDRAVLKLSRRLSLLAGVQVATPDSFARAVAARASVFIG